MTGLLCSPEEASCLIPNLIAELETPCPCEGLEGLVLCGLGYKGQRVTIRVRPGELTIICKAKDLVNHTLQLTNNTKLFPKKVRFTLCQRMQNLSIQILHDIIAANEIYPRTIAEMNTRLDLQKEVLTNCKVFLNFLDIALEQGYIDIRRCEYWTGLTTDVKNLAASWRKKDAERFRQQVQTGGARR